MNPDDLDYLLGDPYIKIKDAAKMLGYSVAWVTKLCLKGRLPHHRAMGPNSPIPGPRGHYRFLAAELRAWMEGETP